MSTRSTPATPQGTIERLRGMADVWPGDRAFRQGIINSLERGFAAHGYRAIDTPVVEATELFLRKSGEERAAQMYAFDYRNRQIALRPEFTASVVRAFVADGQGRPLPQRYSYHGPAFRYEKPQSGRYRQFTELGVELIGAPGPAADAEVIHLALAGLADLGLTDCTLRLGHLGVVGALLTSLKLDDRVRDWFLWSMEQLRQRGDEGLHRNLRALLATQESANGNGARADLDGLNLGPELADFENLVLDNLSDDRAHTTVLGLLRGAGVELAGSNRPPEEIVERLLVKLRRPRATFDINRAVAFLRRLITLRGEPTQVLADTCFCSPITAWTSTSPCRGVEAVLALLRLRCQQTAITLDLGGTRPALLHRCPLRGLRRSHRRARGGAATLRRRSLRRSRPGPRRAVADARLRLRLRRRAHRLRPHRPRHTRHRAARRRYLPLRHRRGHDARPDPRRRRAAQGRVARRTRSARPSPLRQPLLRRARPHPHRRHLRRRGARRRASRPARPRHPHRTAPRPDRASDPLN
ncbi:MAG: ATP phosphoribosyltransferase regulatory subunit [Chloroflexia bacterium]